MRNIVRTDWKVYNPDGEYVAATKDPENAAILVAVFGERAQIRYKHHTLVWTEGKEQQPASESYQFVAETCFDRVQQVRRAALIKHASHYQQEQLRRRAQLDSNPKRDDDNEA